MYLDSILVEVNRDIDSLIKLKIRLRVNNLLELDYTFREQQKEDIEKE
jgi:hypothetical protein